MGGSDFDARRRSKQAAKKGRRESEMGGRGANLLGDTKLKRERKKKTKRRITQGMCWSDPKITEEDKKWSEDGDSDVERAALGSDVEEAAAAGAEPQKPKRERPQAPGDKPVAKKQKKEDGSGRMRLSTSISLLAPAAAAASAASKQGKQAAAAGDGQPGKAAPAAVPPALQPFDPLIQRFMTQQGFAEPTPIQAQSWPSCCGGRDCLGVAQPGSGKTLAYLLPAAVRIAGLGHGAASPPPPGPLALVMVPTRELAVQVAAQARALRPLAGLRAVAVYGGVPKEEQVELLHRAPHVVVATPGRCLDLVEDRTLDLSHTVYVVLDEADKMLGLGLLPQLEQLRALLLPLPPPGPLPGGAKGGKSKRGGADGAAAAAGTSAQRPRPQVLLFSATMPAEVAQAVDAWLHKPLRLAVSTDASCISRGVTQVVQVCAEHKKGKKLLKHLGAIKAAGAGMRNAPRTLIFCNRIKTVRALHSALAAEAFKVRGPALPCPALLGAARVPPGWAGVWSQHTLAVRSCPSHNCRCQRFAPLPPLSLLLLLWPLCWANQAPSANTENTLSPGSCFLAPCCCTALRRW